MSYTFEVESLYYITHILNLSSIFQHGILSHRLVNAISVPATPIYDIDIVNKRKRIVAPDGRSLWAYANLYFQPNNAMLRRVILERGMDDIAILGVHPEILNMPGVYVTNGNAASLMTEIFTAKEGLAYLTHLQERHLAFADSLWCDDDHPRSSIMAECLVPDRVSQEYIHAVYVANEIAADKAKAACAGLEVSITVIAES